MKVNQVNQTDEKQIFQTLEEMGSVTFLQIILCIMLFYVKVKPKRIKRVMSLVRDQPDEAFNLIWHKVNPKEIGTLVKFLETFKKVVQANEQSYPPKLDVEAFCHSVLSSYKPKVGISDKGQLAKEINQGGVIKE